MNDLRFSIHVLRLLITNRIGKRIEDYSMDSGLRGEVASYVLYRSWYAFVSYQYACICTIDAGEFNYQIGMCIYEGCSTCGSWDSSHVIPM
jgi:hypothetical protein